MISSEIQEQSIHNRVHTPTMTSTVDYTDTDNVRIILSKVTSLNSLEFVCHKLPTSNNRNQYVAL